LRAERDALDRRIAAETGNIVRSIVEDAGRARAREREMEQLLGESVQRDMASERAAVRLAELTRAVDAKSTQHRGQLLRLEELQERRELARPGAEVISAATVPQERDFPKPAILLGGGFLGSLVLGLGLAALREQQDSRLRATHQVEQALGLRNLALVPRVRARGPGALHRHVLEKPRSAYSEAIRALALGLDRLLATAPSKVLLVTSALPGEGKTTLAISLAAAMAQRGRRTVLVELDLRRPSVARQLGLGRHASVVEFIEGRSSLDEVVQATGRKHRLDVIAVHRQADNPGELLDSPRLLTLIQLLRQRYDYIVLDAPPSLGIGDVAAIGPAADAALFVARWGSTSSAAARLGVSALVNAGVTVVGCALTQVDLARHARYGYEDAGEYYASYRRYYRP
jgi:capsular exopolysaccharide synthesis family protein